MRRGIRVKLKHLNPSGRFPSGNTRFYHYPWGKKNSNGKKGIRMPDLPIDHPDFMAVYLANVTAYGASPASRQRRPDVEGSLASAITLYKGSDAFLALAVSTRSRRRVMLDDISERYGHADRAGLATKHIEKDLSRFKGHGRNNRLKMWRGFCKWLTDHDHLERDPSDGIKRSATPKSRGHIPWTRDEIETFRAHWPMGSIERLAFELIYWTGARVSDAVRLGPGSIDSEGWINFRQQKTGGEVWIPFNRPLPEFAEVFAPDLARLKTAISERGIRQMTFLHTARGASRSSKAVSQWFAGKARDAGVNGRSAHGLRKSRAIALAEVGGTAPQIGAWTGHESLKEIERYIRDFSKRKALSRTEPEQKVPTFSEKFQKVEK